MSASSFHKRQKSDDGDGDDGNDNSSSDETATYLRQQPKGSHDDHRIVTMTAPTLSRHALLQAMEKLGIDSRSLESLTLEQLYDLFNRLNKLAFDVTAVVPTPSLKNNQKGGERQYPRNHHQHQHQSLHAVEASGGYDDNDDNNNSSIGRVTLSPIDKHMLKLLLASNGTVSSMTLSKELGIPLTTIQRRRKRLAEFLDISCSLALRKFGLRSITFFIAVENGMPTSVAREILGWPGVMSVSRTLSNHKIDIKAEVVLKTNKEVIDFSERIKMMPE